MTDTCASCRQDREIASRGLCDACRSRCRRDHTISEWGEVKAARMEIYASLRTAGWSAVRAAWEVGVSERTARRYEAELRERTLQRAGQVPWRAAAA